jgi:hypothetical protein
MLLSNISDRLAVNLKSELTKGYSSCEWLVTTHMQVPQSRQDIQAMKPNTVQKASLMF